MEELEVPVEAQMFPMKNELSNFELLVVAHEMEVAAATEEDGYLLVRYEDHQVQDETLQVSNEDPTPDVVHLVRNELQQGFDEVRRVQDAVCLALHEVRQVQHVFRWILDEVNRVLNVGLQEQRADSGDLCVDCQDQLSLQLLAEEGNEKSVVDVKCEE